MRRVGDGDWRLRLGERELRGVSGVGRRSGAVYMGFGCEKLLRVGDGSGVRTRLSMKDSRIGEGWRACRRESLRGLCVGERSGVDKMELRKGCRVGDGCADRPKGSILELFWSFNPGTNGEAVRGGISASGGEVKGLWLWLKGNGAWPGEGMGDSKSSP